MSLPLIISGHVFCGHPWLSRSQGSHFSLAAREGLTLVLGHGLCGNPWLSRLEGSPFPLAAMDGLTLVIVSWHENQGILFLLFFPNIANELDIFHGIPP